MAKYEVECASGISDDCEGTFKVQLYGSHDTREWKLENYDWTCDACKEAEREQKNAAAAERNAERGLPDLEGSEKQIGWAESIRDDKIGDLKELEEELRGMDPDEEDRRVVRGLLLEELNKARTETDAGWWIDHRDRSLQRLVRKRARKRFEAGEKPMSDAKAFAREWMEAGGVENPSALGSDQLFMLSLEWSAEAGYDDMERGRQDIEEALFEPTPDG
jgi:hypothetical protein